MTINIKDTLILDDNNEYIVVSKIAYDNKHYFYLLDKNNNDVKFCYEEGEELVEIEDKKLTTKLLPLFLEAAQKEVNN